ncbi:MAG TPA: ABC transporter permease, partial [Candidatus Methylomirabilis sp.]|nr:ABC transporter permease [Candidatus Methylomirabilis sp.]
MTPSLARIALRHLRRHPWQVGLAVLGVALGVAVAVSIDLANESARRAFTLATEAVTGRATHQILGGPSGLPEEVYRELLVDIGMRRAAPVVSGEVAALDYPGRTFTVLGVDPFSEPPFRPYLDAEPAGRGEPGSRDPLFAVAALVTRPGTALLARPTARDLGLVVGDRLNLRVAGSRRALTLVGLIEPADPTSA